MYGFEPDGSLPAGYVRATRLRRVVPIAESRTITEGDLTLTSLDLFEDGSILNYFMVGNEEVIRRQAEHHAEIQRLVGLNDRDALRRYAESTLSVRMGMNVHMRLEDDLATGYQGLARGGGGSENRWESSYGFTPAVPAEATRLRILVFEGEYRRETHEATAREPERLLHTFEVSL